MPIPQSELVWGFVHTDTCRHSAGQLWQDSANFQYPVNSIKDSRILMDILYCFIVGDISGYWCRKDAEGLENTHMHLWSTAPQQVDKSWIEGHDGVPHVDEVIITVLDKISVTQKNHNN